jgi:hypothetical protein
VDGPRRALPPGWGIRWRRTFGDTLVLVVVPPGSGDDDSLEDSLDDPFDDSTEDSLDPIDDPDPSDDQPPETAP